MCRLGQVVWMYNKCVCVYSGYISNYKNTVDTHAQAHNGVTSIDRNSRNAPEKNVITSDLHLHRSS